jgi:Peptidase inhibitor family I36
MHHAIGRGAVALTLALSALTLGTAGSAQAAPSCAKGDFCLWEHVGYHGGRYNWRGDDMNLSNDRFVGGSGRIVAGQSSSAYNNGYRGAYDKVWLYQSRGRLSTCVLPGDDNPGGGGFPDFTEAPFWGGAPWGYKGYSFNINDLVTGFRWASSC